jgi:hypothetical protein
MLADEIVALRPFDSEKSLVSCDLRPVVHLPWMRERSTRFAGSTFGIVRGAQVFAVVMLSLLGCSDKPSPGVVVPPPVSAAPVEAFIGPEGGTLTHSSGARIVVPVGALPASTRLTLTAIQAPAESVLSATPLGRGFEAGPEGQTFLKPVEIALPFDPTLVRPNTDATTAQVRMAPHGSTDFVALDSKVDIAERVIRTQTVHFTQFVPAQSPNPVFITTPSLLPDATVGVAYAQQLAATGGTAPYTWSLSSGSGLPPGLALGSNGSISGQASIATVFAFFVTANDATHAVQKAFFLTALPPTNPIPVLTAIDPTSAQQGSPTTTVTLTGSGFVPTSQANFDGAPLPTTFVNGTGLSAAIPAASLAVPGTHQISVSSPAPGGGVSANVAFVVTAVVQNPVPIIASVSPTSIPVSAVDTNIAILGTNFIPSTSAAIGMQGISTSYVSTTELAATIPASYLATPATLQIGVYNPAPGGGFSVSTVPVTVGSTNPLPTLSGLTPSSVAAGSAAFAVGLTGTNFVSGGQVFFGNTALATTINSATSATATVPATLVTTAGSANVTFINPTPGGGASAPLSFTISASNPRLTELESVPGTIVDLDATRILYVTGTNLRVRTRGTANETTITATFPNTAAFLTDQGAIWSGGEWNGAQVTANTGTWIARGSWALGRRGGDETAECVVKNLATGVESIALPSSVGNYAQCTDINENGDAILQAHEAPSFYQKVYRYRAGTLTRLSNGGVGTTRFISGRTDGTNVVYQWVLLGNSPPQAKVLHTASGESTLAGVTGELKPDLDYALAEGWTAFTNFTYPGAQPSKNVFCEAPLASSRR